MHFLVKNEDMMHIVLNTLMSAATKFDLKVWLSSDFDCPTSSQAFLCLTQDICSLEIKYFHVQRGNHLTFLKCVVRGRQKIGKLISRYPKNKIK